MGTKYVFFWVFILVFSFGFLMVFPAHAATTTLFSDDFDRAKGNTVGNGWIEEQDVGVTEDEDKDAKIESSCKNDNDAEFAPSGVQYAQIRGDSDGEDLVDLDTSIRHIFSTEGYANITFSYFRAQKDVEGVGSSGQDIFIAQWRGDDEGDWTTLESVSPDQDKKCKNIDFDKHEFFLTGAEDKEHVEIRFGIIGTGANDKFLIDDVLVTGELITYDISGYKWNDEDRDGVWGDDETALSDWIITTEGDEYESNTTTDENGYYEFTDLSPGEYTMCEELQDGWTQTYPDQGDGCHEIELEDSDSEDTNFGNNQDITPPVSVFVDPPNQHTVLNSKDSTVTFSGNSQDMSGVASANLQIHQIPGPSFDNYPAQSFFDAFLVLECPVLEGDPIQTEILALDLVTVDPITVSWSHEWAPQELGIYCFEVRATDTAGNQENTAYVGPVAYIPTPQISEEGVQSSGDFLFNNGQLVVSWETSYPATSRVIYDIVSHETLGEAPNYGYAFFTIEDSTLVTEHEITLTEVGPGITYYYRTVSHGSPESVGEEQTIITPSANSAGGFLRKYPYPLFQESFIEEAVSEVSLGETERTESAFEDQGLSDPIIQEFVPSPLADEPPTLEPESTPSLVEEDEDESTLPTFLPESEGSQVPETLSEIPPSIDIPTGDIPSSSSDDDDEEILVAQLDDEPEVLGESILEEFPPSLPVEEEVPESEEATPSPEDPSLRASLLSVATSFWGILFLLLAPIAWFWRQTKKKARLKKDT